MKFAPSRCRSAPAPKPVSVFRENFGTILTTLVSVLTAVSGYFMVTSVQIAQESQRAAIESQKAAREQRAADVMSAKDLRTWVNDLRSENGDVVRSASVSLALGGASNYPTLVAALLIPNQPLGAEIREGLRVASVIDSDAACKYLQKGLLVAQSAAVGSVASTLSELRCVQAVPIMKQVHEKQPGQDLRNAICELERVGAPANSSCSLEVK